MTKHYFFIRREVYETNGSVKDQCLLDAINDLEYTDYFEAKE